MHATVLVLGEDIETLMDPYCIHDEDALDGCWDWWAIGYRAGSWLMATDASGVSFLDLRVDEPFRPVGPGEPCQQVRVGSLDIEGMRQRAAADAAVVWDKAAPVLAKHGLPTPRREFIESVNDSLYRSSEVWEAWRSQPGMSELLDISGFDGDPGVMFDCTGEEFVIRARRNALVEDDFLSEETGWLHSRTYDEYGEPVATPGYAECVNRVITQASADTLVTLVDTHS